MELMVLKPKRIKGFNFAYVTNTGSYKKLSNTVNYLENILEKNDIKFDNVVSVLMDDPNVTEESQLKCELGVILRDYNENNPALAADIKIKRIDDFVGLVFDYTGEIQGIDNYYKAIIKKMTEASYIIAGFPIEFYIKSPINSEKDGLCHTRIIIPIFYTWENKREIND
ncbi:MAG: GyrI-like domain-containing protein [Oscillospiraceae bacterium]|nr:GyrI-like domain-containing protein [Oscillospiraceae bacterium]